ncbi:MAG: tRNA-uridine aminocarboxypropyltransferase [Bdellovibrionota bacterium]
MAGKMPKCSDCHMLQPLCLCQEFVKIANKAKLVLLIHRSELHKTSNSGRLACSSLKNQEMHIVGDEVKPVNWQDLYLSDYENLLLFPSEEARVLSDEYVETLQKPVRLIVLDGNWGQATRMHRRIKKANIAFKHVTLPRGNPSEYRLRTAPERPQGLSTLEAIARALSILDGDKNIMSHLMQIFRIMVTRNLFARGKLSRDKVIGPAFEWP